MVTLLRLGLMACLTWIGWGWTAALAQTPSTTVPDLICDPNREWELDFGAQTHIGREIFRLEVARTPAQQSQGLMFRTTLAPDQGMVFVFLPPQLTRFWMWNTCLNLDIIFLNQGRVIEIAANVPPCRKQPCPVYGPHSRRIDQVVEVVGGTATRLGLKPGDPLKVMFSPP